MHIKDMIINYRTENRYSQRAFAAKCGLSNGYVSMLEKNVNPSTGRPPVYTYATLQKLAYGMDMDVNDLIKSVDNLPIYTGQSLPESLQALPEDTEDDVWEYREAVRRNPEMRILFDAAKGATSKQLKQAVAILEALKASEGNA